MRLIDDMEARRAGEDSLFRRQLLKEDIARLTRLRALAAEHAALAACEKAGLYMGWTPGDISTPVVKEEVRGLVRAMHAYIHGGETADGERAVEAAWAVFDRARMERLVKCL